MSTIDYRANLVAAAFPFLSEDVGRTVIIKQHDQNYIPTISSKSDEDKDAGVPQAYYMHNVLPTDSGYQSISFSAQIAPLVGSADFTDIYFLVSPFGDKVLIAILADGTFKYCTSDTSYAWETLPLPRICTVEFTDPGNGNITGLKVAPDAPVGTYTIDFTSATDFTVTHSISGAQGTGTVGTLFASTDTWLTFLIEAGDVAFTASSQWDITVAAHTADPEAQYSAVYMQGAAYFCISGVGIFEYNFEYASLDWLNVTGLDLENLIGIAAAQGYLLAYSKDAIGWSSLTNAVDFTPSLITGAGGGSVEGARGPLRKVISSATGLYIFTAQNAVSAVFSQNTRYPFIFTTISNCGGLTDASLSTEEAEDSALYAFTTQGLQNISVKTAKSGFPEAADFLTSQLMEDFDSSTLTLSRTPLAEPLKKRLAFVSGRYLVISYGISSFTHAIIYDSSLKRWGKVKFTHVAAFEYGFFDADTADAAKKQLAFLAANGAVHTVDFSSARSVGDSLLILGRYQVLRSKMVQLLGVSVDGVTTTDDFQLYDLPSLNGVDWLAPVEGYLSENGLGTREYKFRNTAVNHTVVCRGRFKINSLQLTLGVGGGR